MAVALRVSSEAFPALRLYQVIQVMVPLTDGVTKPLNCFQGNPLSILKNCLYNNLPLLVPCTLPVKHMKTGAAEDGKDLIHQVLCKRKVSAVRPSQRENTTDSQVLELRTSGMGLQPLSPEAGENGKEMSLGNEWPWCQGLLH